MDYVEVEEINIVEWHPTPDGSGPPQQVHMMIRLVGIPDVTMVLRFKGPVTLTSLINALTEHRNSVFPNN